MQMQRKEDGEMINIMESEEAVGKGWKRKDVEARGRKRRGSRRR